MRLAFSTCRAKIFGEEIFAGTNFRELAFNRENFPLYGSSNYCDNGDSCDGCDSGDGSDYCDSGMVVIL